MTEAAAETVDITHFLHQRRVEAPNPSGIHPTEFKVLLLPKAVEERTKGGIILADVTRDSAKYAELEATIVEVAPGAFTYLTDEDWRGAKPQAGDRVIIAKYSGVRVKGADGVEYLLTNDKDVAAVRR